ncbi:MAG TPA: hypothetical protein VGF95_07440 [Solirubrobacteraceae bacterium]|jgi:hypothetical protein
MRKRPLTAILTVLAVATSPFAIAGCGGKSSSGSEKGETAKTETTHSSGLQKKKVEEKSEY